MSLVSKQDKQVILDFLDRASRIIDGGIARIVGLDGSGRPLVKVLEFGLGEAIKNIQIDYLDPRHLRSGLCGDRRFDREALCFWGNILGREFPDLKQDLIVKPDQVWFVDDAVGFGNTERVLRALVRGAVNPKAVVKLVTAYPKGSVNSVSWLHRADRQGIIQAIEGSLKAISAPNPISRRFYRDLQFTIMSPR